MASEQGVWGFILKHERGEFWVRNLTANGSSFRAKAKPDNAAGIIVWEPAYMQAAMWGTFAVLMPLCTIFMLTPDANKTLWGNLTRAPLVGFVALIMIAINVVLAWRAYKYARRQKEVRVHLACPPNPDPATMRVPRGPDVAQETLDDEADEAFGGTDREQAA